MNASEIEDALRSIRFAREYLVGVFAADQLPTKEFPGAYIVNTDTSSQPGQHWVAFFTTEEGTECFDSFGENPSAYSEYIAEWLKDDFQVVQFETLQSRDSTVCGQYCIYFILFRSYCFSYEDMMSSLAERTEVNDKFVCKFVNKFFKLHTTVQDKYFLMHANARKKR